jgi:hypothetical protein
MKAGIKWYSEDNQGNVFIKDVYWKDTNRRLPLGARVALVLTELCCQEGVGRVSARLVEEGSPG